MYVHDITVGDLPSNNILKIQFLTFDISHRMPPTVWRVLIYCPWSSFPSITVTARAMDTFFTERRSTSNREVNSRSEDMSEIFFRSSLTER